MANPIRIKRRADGGASGAPTTLANAELAYNEVNDTLYIGRGTGGGGGSATTIEVVGGKGAVVLLTSDQTVAGTKTFSSSPIAPTPTANDNSTKVATTAYVATALAGVATGAMNYQGTWNASTNSPALVSSTGTKGYFYKVSTAGATTLDGISSWAVGDMVAYNGTAWDKIDNTDQVTSVAGQTGTVVLTKSDVGLNLVDNTADASKPISTAQQTALNLKANLASPTFTGTVSGITSAMVGLGNVTNTSDADKPVSTAQQTALNLKLSTSDTIDGGTF